MKKDSKATVVDYEKFNWNNFIYYGVFISREETGDKWNRYKSNIKKVDPKRLKKTLTGITDEMFEVMSNRSTKYFFPKYRRETDYVINNIRILLKSAINDWKWEYSSMINVLEDPKEFYKNCVNDHIATPKMTNEERKNHCKRLMYRKRDENHLIQNSVMCQYLLYVNSRLDALVRDQFMKRRMYFSRSFTGDLYKFYEEKIKTSMRETSIFKLHDRFNTLYKFVKHTSLDNYNLLVDNYPELLVKYHKSAFREEGLTIALLDLNDDIILSLFRELVEFYENYCQVVFKEDIEESKWNHGDFFYDTAWNWIKMLDDPMGINPWG